jgi:hypothetical protein
LRHDAQAKAEAAQNEDSTSKSETAALAKELATKDKLQRGEAKARREFLQKAKKMEKELGQLRTFKAQFLTWTAGLKRTGSAD